GGLPVLAADANHELSSTSRRALALLVGVLAVFLVLLAIRRRVRLAAVPLIPIALATGWSAALLFLLRIPLNPMSAALGALVIAISTEFSVLLSARYREERERGESPAGAIDRPYRSTGAAVLASGATAIAGFAALLASIIRMLCQFGIVTVVDLTLLLLLGDRDRVRARDHRRRRERAPTLGRRLSRHSRREALCSVRGAARHQQPQQRRQHPAPRRQRPSGGVLGAPARRGQPLRPEAQ